jgi:hypothetical protein
MSSRPISGPARAQPARILYPGIALMIAVVVGVGFVPTLGARLIHPPSPRPAVLYLHVALFVAWVLVFVVQTLLVHSRRIRWHRRLGVFGAMMGTSMPIIGIATALTMTRLAANGVAGEAALAISFFDMFAFASAFGLAVWLRHRPDYHRRLMLMASCGLTVAAFARFPAWLMPDNAWYIAVDALILVAVLRDVIVERRIHPVFKVGLPLLMAGQATAMWIFLNRWPIWLSIARSLLRTLPPPT